MSEDIKKQLRTQGKYSNEKSFHKTRDKRLKESPNEREPPEKKSQKRNSSGHKEQNVSLGSENESSVRYQESSYYTFNELEERKRPVEIRSPGKHILSETENGISSVLYEPLFMNEDEADDHFEKIYNSTEWSSKNIIIRDKEYPQPRLVAWYGPFPYSYSGVILEAKEMPDCVLAIKQKVEDYLIMKGINITLNSVLINCYRDGKDSVAWHSDDELTMGVCPTIASVSLGETRKFEMKRKVQSYSEEIFEDEVDQFFVNLTHGSLIVMNGSMQEDWKHRIPKEYHERDVRINLTFRTVYSLDETPHESCATKFKSSGRNNTLDASPGGEINLNDENFPPLTSPITTKDSECDMEVENKNFPTHSTPINSFSNNEDSYENSVNSIASFTACDESPNSRHYSDSKMTHDQNNLNDPKQSIKHHMPNKNVCASSDLDEVAESTEKNDSSSSISFSHNEHMMNHSQDSPVYNSPRNFHDVDANCSQKYQLNAYAKPFIPSAVSSPNCSTMDYGNNERENYGSYDLEKLLECNIQHIQGDDFYNYAYALKIRINDKIDEFGYFEKSELNFLVDLMVEKLPEQCQRKITDRMRMTTKKYFEKLQNNSKSNSRYHHREEFWDNEKDSHTSNRGKGYSSRDKQYEPRRQRYPDRQEYSSRGEEYSRKQRSSGGNEFSNSNEEYVRRPRNSSRGGRYSNRRDRQSDQGFGSGHY